MSSVFYARFNESKIVPQPTAVFGKFSMTDMVVTEVRTMNWLAHLGR